MQGKTESDNVLILMLNLCVLHLNQSQIILFKNHLTTVHAPAKHPARNKFSNGAVLSSQGLSLPLDGTSCMPKRKLAKATLWYKPVKSSGGVKPL